MRRNSNFYLRDRPASSALRVFRRQVSPGQKPDTSCETGRQVIAFRAADELGLATPTPVRWSMWALPQ